MRNVHIAFSLPREELLSTSRGTSFYRHFTSNACKDSPSENAAFALKSNTINAVIKI